MQNADLIRVNCIYCDKRVGLRPDQLGRRVRCPSCKRTFQVDRPSEHGGPIYVGPEAGVESDSPPSWEPVDDANEMVKVAQPPPPPRSKAKLGATFQRRQALVYQTAVRAIRECGCEIVELDKANHHVRFSLCLPGGSATEHDLYVFDQAGGFCEMDLTSREPDEDGQAELCFQAIVREMGKYLLFAADAEAPAPPPSPPPPPPREEYDDYTPRYRRRREAPAGIKVPILVSAISNILVGLLWASTCIGIVFTVPMVILCVFGFALWSRADQLPPYRLKSEAKTLAIFEIIVGLANTPTLICGIILMINSGNLVSRYDE